MFNINKHIVYFISFVFGLSIFYTIYNPKKKQLKYPSGSDSENFIDENGVCYRYNKEYIDC